MDNDNQNNNLQKNTNPNDSPQVNESQTNESQQNTNPTPNIERTEFDPQPPKPKEEPPENPEFSNINLDNIQTPDRPNLFVKTKKINSKTLLAIIVIVLLLGAAAVAFFVFDPLDLNSSKSNKGSNNGGGTSVLSENAEFSITYEYGGGFGTIADTATRKISIKNDGTVTISLSQNPHPRLEFEEKRITISETDAKEIRDLIRTGGVLDEEFGTNDDILDAGSSTLSFTEGTEIHVLGGYAATASSEKFAKVRDLIWEKVGKDEISAFEATITEKDDVDINDEDDFEIQYSVNIKTE